MLKENPKETPQTELFRSHLDQIIDTKHELAQMSRLIDWDGLSADLSAFYCLKTGRPGGSIRLMARSRP